MSELLGTAVVAFKLLTNLQGEPPDPADIPISATSPVTTCVAHVTGLIFTDQNGNGLLDPGEKPVDSWPEGLAYIYDGSFGDPAHPSTAIVDQFGRFNFDMLLRRTWTDGYISYLKMVGGYIYEATGGSYRTECGDRVNQWDVSGRIRTNIYFPLVEQLTPGVRYVRTLGNKGYMERKLTGPNGLYVRR